jgi:hypothetical protein
LELLDNLGNHQFVEGDGTLHSARHESVLSALADRANSFRRNVILNNRQRNRNNVVDETDTVNFPGVDVQAASEELQAQIQEELAARTVSDEVLTVHGTAPGRKQEGVFRLLYENANGIDCRNMEGHKIRKARVIHDRLEADAVAYNEHRINYRHKDNEIGFGQLFRGGETEMRSIVAHNTHENVRRVQEGGTALMLFGSSVQHFNAPESGRDETGLGRWVVITLSGAEGFTTRIVCGYNPCGNGRIDSGTVYAQHKRYYMMRGCVDCPRIKFRQDLIEVLTRWRSQGDRLVVCLDANEDIYKKSIGKALTDLNGLAMKEVVGVYTGKKVGATYFRGSKPIDGVWATSDVTVTSACIMPVRYGIGDHRMFIVDLLTSSLIGADPIRVARPCARRLTTKLPGVVRTYNSSLEDLVLKHRIIERLGAAHEDSRTNEVAAMRMDIVDRDFRDYMLHAEKKCRKIKSGLIPFSPESEVWIRRRQTYLTLLKYTQGIHINRGNTIRAARRCGILNPLQLSESEILLRLKICNDHCTYYREHGLPYRRRHLQNRAEIARQNGNEEGAQQILNMIVRERQREHWRKLRGAMGHQAGRSVQSVQVEQETGEIVEHTSQDSIQTAIWDNIHRRRFFLAEEAPICKDRLRQEFGYLSNTEAARAVLDGTYTPTGDIDPATSDLFSAIADIRAIVPQDHVSTIVTAGDWGRHWTQGVHEETSSSESKLHFGHQIASAHSPLLSHAHATQCSILLRRGIHLTRWARGLSVMLEKIRGCSLVSKLRSILLMEADANAINKMIFGVRMLQTVREFKLMPEEIFSERNRTADDGTLSKVLFYDLVRQSRRPAGVASVDADNCFDRVAHAVASLVFQSFGVSANASTAMLSTIQEMKFFLRTAFGDSTTAAGSRVEIKTQGLCQGSGAAPAGWAVVSIAILHAHKKNGHGATFLCPITGSFSRLSAILFVDDTDVIHFRMDADESALEAHQHLQDSILSWGNLLIATGGSLKPAKCFYHLISFAWNQKGQWSYSKNEDEDCLGIVIPQPDDTVVPITHLGVNDASKTLGSMTCPSGDTRAALARIQDKAQEWIDKVKNAGLSRRNMWFLLEHQFLPKVVFGCSTIAAPFDEISTALHRQYFQLLPFGGIRRSVRKEVRYLGKSFFGSGCPHLGVECFVGQMEKLLTHYGSQTVVGKLMQSSMELFIIELGMSSQPFAEDYNIGSYWTSHSWLKSVWEKVNRFHVEMFIGNVRIIPPRAGDDWLMKRFLSMGFSRTELIRLNRVRLAQQVLFVSDVLDAGGRALDRKYLLRRPHRDKWSSLCFPREMPSRKDYKLWRHALLQLRPGGRHSETRVREFVEEGHKIWEWRYDEEGQRLFHFTQEGVLDVYIPSQVPGFGRRPNCWTRTAPWNVTREDNGVVCSVKEVDIAVMAICSYSPLPPVQALPTTLWEVLTSWECTWMWDHLRISGDTNWLIDAIRSEDCIAVADGSFMRDLTTEVCATAFFFENTDRSRKVVGAFPERSETANAYRGELLGLMAVHLLLLAVNKLETKLTGSIVIYSDCERAIGSVGSLPTLKIPARLKHSDILKNILVNCSDLSFRVEYQHIRAHQDDKTAFHLLSRPAQLNCAVDAGAKKQLLELDPTAPPRQHRFPLEPIVCFAGTWKLTASMSWFMRFHAHKQLARTALSNMEVLTTRQFNEIAWFHVAKALDEVPRMFQLWACKQVLGIANTNGIASKWDASVDPCCPSCKQCTETSAHILHCPEIGRVNTLLKTIDHMAEWLLSVDTDPVLVDCILQYARGRGAVRMEDICESLDGRFRGMAISQDKIGWRRFMEGMISRGMVVIQSEYLHLHGINWKLNRWATGLVIKLLEVTHGQWLYRNVVVHDRVVGDLAMMHKEGIRAEIEAQIDHGVEGLLEEHAYLLEVNLDELDDSDGSQHEYWLLAIRAARVACASRSENVEGLTRLRPRNMVRVQDGSDYG